MVDDQDDAAPPGAEPAAGAAGQAERWLAILQRVSEGATAHLDLQALMREILARVREAMAVDNAAILLLDPDGRNLTVYAARGPEEAVEGIARIPYGRGVAGTIAATARPLIVDDLSAVEVENPLLRATVRSLVGVPLVVQGHVIGVIHVDSARPRRFTMDDARLLELIAGRVALAIEHSRLYEAERAARRRAESLARQLEALQAVSDVALAHARLEDLLQALLVRLQEAMGVDNVAILLPVPDMSELMLYSVHGPEAAVMGAVHVPMGEGVAGKIAATREPLIVDNLAVVPVANPFLREHFHSLLGVPLLVDGRLIGVLHVDTVAARHFTPEDVERLEAIGERIAAAIDRARTFEVVEQERAEAENRAAALETTRRMDEFLSIASHELRTPLTVLKANVQMLDYWLDGRRGRRADEPEATYRSRVVEIAPPLVRRSIGNIARLDRLVGELLDASRIREGRLALQPAPADLARVVREVVAEVRQAHPGRTVRLEEPEHSLPVVVDADRIGQVVANFLSNALKYSPPDAPVVVRVRTDGERARVAVRDRGVGIPADEHGAIWERFYRVASIGHQSGSEVGLGLGLYISRDIVERHGGQVGVASAPGAGSTFWFTVPLVSDPRADA